MISVVVMHQVVPNSIINRFKNSLKNSLRLYNIVVFVNITSGAVFTTLYFLFNMYMYISMKHALLQTLKISACTSIFRHPVLC